MGGGRSGSKARFGFCGPVTKRLCVSSPGSLPRSAKTKGRDKTIEHSEKQTKYYSTETPFPRAGRQGAGSLTRGASETKKQTNNQRKKKEERDRRTAVWRTRAENKQVCRAWKSGSRSHHSKAKAALENRAAVHHGAVMKGHLLARSPPPPPPYPGRRRRWNTRMRGSIAAATYRKGLC